MLRRTAVMTLLLASISSLAHAGEYAPLDCHLARSAADRTICDSYALGQSEARMATLYSVATSLVAMGQRGDIQDAQTAWLRAREACGTNKNLLGRGVPATHRRPPTGHRRHRLSRAVLSLSREYPYEPRERAW